MNSFPNMKKKNKIHKMLNNNGSNEEYINNNKRKKKVLKNIVHELKQLRENQFKIENINNIKNAENVEEHVEKYFDKNGKCIGGKKLIIKQE